MDTPILTKTFVAAAAIAAYRIAAIGSADGEAAVAAAATAPILGVTGKVGADAAGDHVDVKVAGFADVIYGGTVTRGDWLTADGEGRAITTTTAGNSTIGRALVSGVVGDRGSVDISKIRY